MRFGTIVKTSLILVALAGLAASIAAVKKPDAVPWATAAKEHVVQWWRNAGEAQPQHRAAPAARSRVVAEGRVVTYPGREITLSAEYAGMVSKLAVEELSTVRKGDLIAEIGCEERHAELAEVKARIGECEADIALAQWRLERSQELAKNGASSRDEVQEHIRNLAAGQARRSALLATARRLETIIAKSTIRAPIDGTVIQRSVDAGEMISVGQPLVTIADVSRTRIEAEVDEFDAGRVRVGAEVLVSSDGFPDIAWKGIVEEVPDVVVARRMKPEDPSRPTDTRVLLAKIVLKGPAPLKLGQRVEMAIQRPTMQANEQEKASAMLGD